MNRDDVIAVAMQAYWTEGPMNVSLNEVCARAGVSKPSVYREFGNDDGLTAAALEAYVHTVLVKLMEIAGGDDPFATKISRIAHLAAASSLHHSGCLFVKMRSVQEQMGPKTQALIGQVETLALEAFATLLSEARASGAWTNPMPVALAAAYLHAQIGLALDQRGRGEDPTEILDLALTVLIPPAA